MAAANTTSYPSSIGGGNALTADNSSNFGMNGFMANAGAMTNNAINAIDLASNTSYTMTGAQFVSAIWDVAGSPGGGVTFTTPTAAQIIAALPNTIPKNGTFNFAVKCLNDATGQTLTITAGSNVTLVGTMTVATNTVRSLVVNVNVNAGTVTVMNLGSVSL